MKPHPHLVLRIVVVIVALAMAAGMLWMGLWQMSKYEQQGREKFRERATAAPVALLPAIPPGGSIGDVYGRRVHVRGRYLDRSLDVVDSDGRHRQLTAYQLDDGRVLPVVRGAGERRPPRPEPEVRGVFLPSEAGDDRGVGENRLSSVRLPQLAQRWPEPLTPGFVTLDADQARAQELMPVEVALPEGEGQLSNFSYAIQWWVFAAFAVLAGILVERALGRAEAPLNGPADASRRA